MASEPIHVSDDRELTRILEEASERPVRFERNGIVYRLSAERPKNDLWANYDPEAAKRAVREATGAIPGETDELVEQLYEARRIGSRPCTRP